MGLYLEDNIVKYIKQYKNSLTHDDEEILRYGIQIYYLNISKLLILFLFSITFDVFLETCIVFFLIALLKRSAYGFHAETFWSCLALSFVNIFGIIFLSKLSFNPFVKIALAFTSLLMFALYAPADTEERPLVNYKKRKQLKIQTIFIGLLYCTISFLVDKVLSNMLILTQLFIGFNTCPILYILFKKEYKNYENFI